MCVFRVMVVLMSGYFWVTIESCVLLGWQCRVCLLDGMQWLRPSLVGVVVCMVRICMVEAAKWLTVLLCGCCESWREGRHGGELHGLYEAPMLLCIQLPSPVNM
jgi:hypothetical protein